MFQLFFTYLMLEKGLRKLQYCSSILKFNLRIYDKKKLYGLYTSNTNYKRMKNPTNSPNKNYKQSGYKLQTLWITTNWEIQQKKNYLGYFVENSYELLIKFNSDPQKND